MLFRSFSKYSLPMALVAATASSSIAAPGDVVNLNGIYGREHSLPLCDWSSDERSLGQFMFTYDQTWQCTSMADRSSCAWSGREPSTARYWFHPRHEPRFQGDTYYTEALDLTWPDSSSLYGTWNMSCEKPVRRKGMPAPIPGFHRVLGSVVEGAFVPGTPTCTGADPATEMVLLEVDGGTLEHIRPGYVRGSVQIANVRFLTPSNDLRVVIQGRVDGGWEDLAATAATTTATPATYSVEATVPELTDVRLQVRGKVRCNAQYGTGYDVRDARLFVETCVPDVSNPGECL